MPVARGNSNYSNAISEMLEDKDLLPNLISDYGIDFSGENVEELIKEILEVVLV